MKFEKTRVSGFENALFGARNPMNSWGRSDSKYGLNCSKNDEDFYEVVNAYYKKLNTSDDIVGPWLCKNGRRYENHDYYEYVYIGPNDLDLAQRLCKAGPEHRKFLRQIQVSVDITAPLYWWKEMDQYRINVTTNSESTMHTIMKKEFTQDMFEISNLRGYKKVVPQEIVFDESKEIWKQYPYGNLYEVSNYGRIKRKKYVTSQNHILPEVILKWQYSADGYAYVGVKTTKTDNIKKNRRVHVLVAETFLPAPIDPNKTQVNHIDGNKLNNSVSNLEWVTPKENSIDRSENGLQPKKIYTYTGKLTKEQQEEILFRLSTENISNRQIAKEYGVSHTTINSLVNNKYDYGEHYQNEYQDFLKIIDKLNILRDEWLETKDKEVWYSLIIMLPESWLQTRMITMNYENVRNICAQRQGHRLTEWASFIAWAQELPYADALIFDEDIKTFLKNIV